MDSQLTHEIELLHDRVCKAFADPKRVMILYSLNERPRFVNELAEELNMPQSTVSRHLKILRDRSIVRTERDGTTVTYILNDQRVIQALDLLRGVLRDVVLKQARVVDHTDSDE